MEQIQSTSEEYTLRTHDIQISVSPNFEDSRSSIANNVYAYSYTVSIENFSTLTVQLVNRHWLVYSGGKQIADVKGEGVIGDQPTLAPGDSYEYTSGSIIKDAIGSMTGTYTFVNQDGEFFDVKIPEFFLVYMQSQEVH